MHPVSYFLPKSAATAHETGSKQFRQTKTFSFGYKGQKPAELNSLTDTCKTEHKIFGKVPKMLWNGSFPGYDFFYHLGPILNSAHEIAVAQWFCALKVSC